MAESTTGKLLVATPAISDGIFDQAVVFMLHHDPVGALGVIINDPADLPVEELLPRWTDLLVTPSSLFTGGPVEPNGFIGVGRLAPGAEPDSYCSRIGDAGLVTVDLDADARLVAGTVDRLRVFRGYAGWSPGQLDGELVAGAWFVLDDAEDLWTDEPTTLYERVLRRQNSDVRWFANAPTDPSVN